MLLDDLEEAPVVGRVLKASREERLDEGLHGGQGRAQLVARIRDEIAPHALEGGQARDVEEQADGPDLGPGGVGERGGGDLEGWVRARDGGDGGARFLAAPHLPRRLPSSRTRATLGATHTRISRSRPRTAR